MSSFKWQVDPTPDWFNDMASSYRYVTDTKQIELPTMQGNVLVSVGDTVAMGQAGFFIINGVEPMKPNRETRRKNMKQKEQRMVLKGITCTFEDGQSVELDISKVMIIDRETKAQLFTEVMEQK